MDVGALERIRIGGCGGLLIPGTWSFELELSACFFLINSFRSKALKDFCARQAILKLALRTSRHLLTHIHTSRGHWAWARRIFIGCNWRERFWRIHWLFLFLCRTGCVLIDRIDDDIFSNRSLVNLRLFLLQLQIYNSRLELGVLVYYFSENILHIQHTLLKLSFSRS